MGRKRRKPAEGAERIFCYYCERDFKTEAILVNHQREKHLKCPTCHKRLTSVNGLAIHSSQVHKITLDGVPNALPERKSLEHDVFGMDGIPYHLLDPEPPSKAPKTAPGSPASYPSSQQPLSHYHPHYAQGVAPNAPVINPPSFYPHYANPNPHPAFYPYPPRGPYNAHPHQVYSGHYYPPGPSRHHAQPYSRYPVSTDAQRGYENATGTAKRHAVLPVPDAPPPDLSGVSKAGRSQGVEEDIVFTELETSMEELRAKLPRYDRKKESR